MTPRLAPEGLHPPTHGQEDQGGPSAGTATFPWAQPPGDTPRPGFCSHPPPSGSHALSSRPEPLVHGRIGTRSCMGAGMCVCSTRAGGPLHVLRCVRVP